jgi:steroid 5-alpha reductase family enzyme
MLVWAVRLTYNWSRGWSGLDHEDWRYTDFHVRFPKLYWGISFFGLHMLPTLQVFLACIPLYYVVAASSRPLGWIDALAVIVTAVGIFFETVGDRQLHDFVNGPKKPGETLNTGLWRYTRHPNYFGDFCVWWGFYVIAVGAGAWWALPGPVVMTVFLLKVSGVALLEKDIGERRPKYREYIARTNAFFPGPPRAPEQAR